MKLLSYLKKPTDTYIYYLFLINGLVVVLILSSIFLLLLKTALPTFFETSLLDFLSTTTWNPDAWDGNEYYGIITMVVSTLLVTCGAMLIAIPIGVGTATYLSEIAPPRIREIIKPIIELLSSIPSVVLGFLGIVVFGPFIAKLFNLSNGLNALNGSILLSIMALPTIISLSEDALKRVPNEYELASSALGASKMQTILNIKIPAAISGIFASIMLGMGRSIGETMTVLMATGCAPAMPDGFLSAARTLTATIAIELGEVAFDSTHYHALFSVGLILFIISFFINMTADLVLNRIEKY